jgi:hypothetical protein
MTDEDDVADAPATRRADGRDTFRPVSADDYFRRRVRDDHATNAALHAAIKAAAADDDRIASVNLMGSHAPGEKDHEPRYYVRVTFANGGMGEPSTGPTFVNRLIEKGDVRVTKAYGGAKYGDVDVEPGLSADEAVRSTIAQATDELTIHLRPVETRVEPVEVPVRDVPDDVVGVSEDTVAAFLGDVDTRLHDELRSVSALRIFRDVVDDYDHALPDPDRDGADDRLQDLGVRLSDFPDGWRDQEIGPSAPVDMVEAFEDLAARYDDLASEGITDEHTPEDVAERVASDIRVALDDTVDNLESPDRPPVGPIEEWVEGNIDVFLTDSDPREVAEQIADAIAENNDVPVRSKCVTFECTNDTDTVRRYQLPSGFTLDLPFCADCIGHFEESTEGTYAATDVDGEEWAHDPIEGPRHALRIVQAIMSQHTPEPYRIAWEGPDDDRTSDQLDAIIDRAKAREPWGFEPATTEQIEDFRKEFGTESDLNFPRNDVFDQFVPYSRRRQGAADVHIAVQDKGDGTLAAQRDGKAGEWHEVDTGFGIWNVRVDVGASTPAAKPVTAYVCHGCERKSLPEDFFVPSCSCDEHDEAACDECGGHAGPRCPRCGTPVDWDKGVGGDE